MLPGPDFAARAMRSNTYHARAALITVVAAALVVAFKIADDRAAAPVGASIAKVPPVGSVRAIPTAMAIRVVYGDGAIAVIRRALDDFLPLVGAFDAAERLYMETLLSREIPASAVKIGSTINIPASSLIGAAKKARALSSEQRRAWEGILRNSWK